MHVEVVDPRDTRWEDDRPVYRVSLWSPDGLVCDAHRLTGVEDVTAVLDWADAQTVVGSEREGWAAEVWVERLDRTDGPGLICLKPRTAGRS
jgi:hypothetical protein